MEELTRPFSREIELLDTIPGVDKRAAEMLLAGIGPDMSRFPTDAHLASWGGMCPGQRESGGKKHSAAYHVLKQGIPYQELGEEFFYRRDTENTERYRRRLVHQLERLGHQVTLEPLPEAA